MGSGSQRQKKKKDEKYKIIEEETWTAEVEDETVGEQEVKDKKIHKDEVNKRNKVNKKGTKQKE